MKLKYLLLLTSGEALETLGTEQACDDPLLGDHSKRLNENDGFPDQGTVMYVCDPEFFGQSGSYTTIKETVFRVSVCFNDFLKFDSSPSLIRLYLMACIYSGCFKEI